MSLVNFTLPFGGVVTPPNWATISPIQQHATAVNNLLYNPDDHQNTDNLPSDPQHPYYKNDPYAPPTQPQQQQQQHRRQNYRSHTFSSQSSSSISSSASASVSSLSQQTFQQQPRPYRSRNNNYLPPPPSPPQQQIIQTQPETIQTLTTVAGNFQQTQTSRTYGEGNYKPQYPDIQPAETPPPPIYNQNIDTNINVNENDNNNNSNNVNFDNNNNNVKQTNTDDFDSQRIPSYEPIIPNITPHPEISNENTPRTANYNTGSGDTDQNYPENQPTYTQVQAGRGSKTQVHAVLDYDGDEYDAKTNAPEGKFFYCIYFQLKLMFFCIILI